MRAIPALLLLAAPALAHDLPLGDGRLSTEEPRPGYVLACRRDFPGGGGAHAAGPWIRNGRWHPEERPQVEGRVAWPEARLSVALEGPERVLRLNRLPLHETGEYPIRPGSAAHRWDRNPNRITAAEVVARLPAAPVPLAQPLCVPMGVIGWALSGAAIFNAFDLAGRDAPAWEIQDLCNGHPERNGVYHYHDWSPCLARFATSEDAPVGWMLDGFPILGPVDTAGREVTNADLDECHGRVGEVEIAPGRRVTTYHYRFTREFPYTLGCFRAAPARRP